MLAGRIAAVKPGVVVSQMFHGRVQFLLPLCLADMDRTDLAMTITPADGFYVGNTCLTLEMEEFFERYTNGVPYADCLISERRGELLPHKKHVLPLEMAERLADLTMARMKVEKQEYMDTHGVVVDKSVEYLMTSVLTNILRKSMSKELLHIV